MADGFLGRWARRKQDARQGRALEQPQPAPAAAAPIPPPAANTASSASAVQAPASLTQTAAPQEQTASSPQQVPAVPTLEDALQLTPQSDFKPFVANGVAPEVRNAAMKKLFADPHFNVMDGLDIYIDDYSIPSPLPASMLRRMVGAQMLNLFDDEEKPSVGAASAQPVPPAAQASEALPSAPPDAPLAAQSQPEQPEVAHSDLPLPQDNHANPDMRLQPDHAPGSQGPGRGTG
ncbi:MAG: DUF3306 domain-containing protein [Hylemonella sp.]